MLGNQKVKITGYFPVLAECFLPIYSAIARHSRIVLGELEKLSLEENVTGKEQVPES